MAFQNIVFPALKLIHDFKKQALLPVSVVGNGAAEYRVARMRWEKFTWTYPARAILSTDKLTLYQFYKQTSGALDSFKFVDPDYPAWKGDQLSFNSSTYWNFCLPYSGNHPLFNYDSAMVVKKNGAVTSYSFSIVNGFPVLSIPGSVSTDVITVASGTIYLTARFDSAMSWSLAALNSDNTPYVVNLDNLMLIEVFEHA